MQASLIREMAPITCGSLLPQVRSTSARFRSAVRPSSQAARRIAPTLGPRFYSGLMATEDPCGSELAPGGVPTMALCWATCFFAGVHIRCCGNGCLGGRPDGGSLWKSPKVTKGLLPLTFGASLWLGIPSLRSCSVGPPPSAIHGRGRLTRHPCRVAHCAEPALGLTRGRTPQQRPRRPTGRPGCWVRSSVRCLVGLQTAIASKLAPTGFGGVNQALEVSG
jgi:hypothetical protein